KVGLGSGHDHAAHCGERHDCAYVGDGDGQRHPAVTATVQNTSNTAVTWQVNGVTGGNATVGTISSSGLYTAPASPATVTVTAVSQADTTKSASAQVTITPPTAVSVTIAPTSATVAARGTQQFTATVQNTSNTA